MKDLLLEIASDIKVEQSNGKLKQTYGRALKQKLNECMLGVMQEFESELVEVGIVKNGVGVAIDNEKVGYISFEVCVVIKDLNYDLADEIEQYQTELDNKAQAKAETERLKALKIAQDSEKRRLKAELKALEVANADKDSVGGELTRRLLKIANETE